MIKSVIFDVGNVLLKWSAPDVVRACVADADQHQRYLDAIFLHRRWQDLDAGVLDESVAAIGIAQELGIGIDEVERVLEAARVSLMPLAPGMALLDEFSAKGIDLSCLTNMSRETYAYLRPRFGFWEKFRGIVVSGHVRLAKPDPAVFRHIVDNLALVTQSTLFIDDHPPNVAAARALGLAAVEYDGSPACLETIRALVFRTGCAP